MKKVARKGKSGYYLPPLFIIIRNMPKLTNNKLRTESLSTLLTELGLELKDCDMKCQEDTISFLMQSQKSYDNLIETLPFIIKGESDTLPEVIIKSLSDLVLDEITKGECSDPSLTETHRRSCFAVFNVLATGGIEYSIDEARENFEFKIPSPIYIELFKTLSYPGLTISKDSIKLNIYHLLKSYEDSILAINEISIPLILCSYNLFKKNKIYYVKQKLEDDKIKVTPYFFLPEALCPPHYHFILDTSSSMAGKNLEILKKNVLTLSTALFDYQPNAILSVSAFNSEIYPLGLFNKDNFRRLKREVMKLESSGLTCLYEVTQKQLDYMMKNNDANNTLLFTDGKNTSGMDSTLVKLLNRSVDILKKDQLKLARNKLFVISYDSIQPPIMYKLTSLFNSPIIKTTSPDFIDALSNTTKLQEWAAKRDLFSFKIAISETTSDTRTEDYLILHDLSGQCTALRSVELKKGETYHLEIKDGEGELILEENRTFQEEFPLVSSRFSDVTTQGFFAKIPTPIIRTSTTISDLSFS